MIQESFMNFFCAICTLWKTELLKYFYRDGNKLGAPIKDLNTNVASYIVRLQSDGTSSSQSQLGVLCHFANSLPIAAFNAVPLYLSSVQRNLVRSLTPHEVIVLQFVDAGILLLICGKCSQFTAKICTALTKSYLSRNGNAFKHPLKY